MRSNAITSAVFSLAALAAPSHAYWRMPCPGRIVTERIDPIVAPGAVADHVHTVSGGNGFNFSMDYASTQGSQCSSCPITQDLSNYWTPALYYMNQNGTFTYVPQAGDGVGVNGGMTVYYLQRGGPNNDNLTAYPEGFRMLAGTPTNRAYVNDFTGQAVSFVCLNYSSTSPYYNKLPDQPCPDGLRAQIFFPSCWDGVNLDTPDHKSHMAYPTEYSYDNGPCPASHPVHMVSVFYEIIYSTIQFDWWVPTGGWQPFVFSMGDPTGYGFHGDFLNGWDVPTLQLATDTCTADTGLITDCPVFEFFTNQQCESCIIAPQVHEQITGTMANLPGCNPITWANGTVTPCNQVSTIGDPYSYNISAPNWTYLGCGFDNGVTRTFSADQWWSNDVTVEGCMDYCKSRGHDYAGLEYATQCFCGDTLPASQAPVPGVLGNCFTPCAGNSSEYCGGSNVLSIYYNNASTFTSVSNGKSVYVSCPASNNTIYTASNNANFTVECGIDHQAGDLSMQYVPAGNITACMETCANTNGCTYVALSGAACYMKTGSSLLPVYNSNIKGAQLISAGTITTSTTTSAATGATGATTVPSSTATMCPGADGQTVGGYTVHCSSDSSVGSYSNAQASVSYLDCMTACNNSASTNCIGFVYVGGANGLGSGTCWLKTNMGTFITAGGSNYVAASKPKSSSTTGSVSSTSASASAATVPGTMSTAAPACPQSNSTYYTASTGAQYLIECGIDHSSGDLAEVGVTSFQGCIEACANTTGCVDVSLSGSACYMKSSVGTASYGSGVLGARLMTSGSASNVHAKFVAVVNAAGNTAKISKGSNKTSKKATKVTKKTKTPKKGNKTTKKVSSGEKASSKTVKKTTVTKPASTTASPSSTVTAIACPYTNNTIYVEPESGYKFLLQCGVDHTGGNLTHVEAKNLTACIPHCAANSSCVDVSFSRGVCYLKHSIGPKTFDRSVNGAKLLSKRPSSSSAEVSASTSIFKPASVIASDPVGMSTSPTVAATPSPTVAGGKKKRYLRLDTNHYGHK